MGIDGADGAGAVGSGEVAAGGGGGQVVGGGGLGAEKALRGGEWW